MIDTQMLAYLAPKDLNARDDWAREHFEWHQKIYSEAIRQGFQRFDTFPALADMTELEGWAYFHNLEHQNLTQSIFIGESPDLSYLEPEDAEAWEDWMRVHAIIHTDIRSALKII
jgi:hypothetical protein